MYNPDNPWMYVLKCHDIYNVCCLGSWVKLNFAWPCVCSLGCCRDVSSVELLMNNHQGIKAEIDARNDSFTACIELGKSLLARKHYASDEVRDKPAHSKYGNKMEQCTVQSTVVFPFLHLRLQVHLIIVFHLHLVHRLKKSCYSWRTRGKKWLTNGRTDGSG